MVHLKRFSYNRCWRDKLDTVVDFPIRYDSQPDLSRDAFNNTTIAWATCNQSEEVLTQEVTTTANAGFYSSVE